MYLCNCQCSNTGSETLLCLTPPQQFKETKAVFAKKIQAMFFASQNGSTKEEENVTGHISTDVIFSVLHNTHRIILSAFAEKLKPVTFTFAWVNGQDSIKLEILLFSSDFKNWKMKDYSIKNMMCILESGDILKLQFRTGRRKTAYKKVSFLQKCPFWWNLVFFFRKSFYQKCSNRSIVCWPTSVFSPDCILGLLVRWNGRPPLVQDQGVGRAHWSQP